MKKLLMFSILFFLLAISSVLALSCQTDQDCRELVCPEGGFVHEVCINSTCQLLSSCTTQNQTCIQEGKKGFITKQIPDKCCEGLVQLANSLGSNGLCYAPTDGSFVCSKCGNGICGLGENVCNCPKDCPSTNKTQTCTDSDGGLNYYVKGLTVEGGDAIAIDNCEDSIILREMYCDNFKGSMIKYSCPNGCKDGACIKEGVSEQVKCIFKNSKEMQKCYLSVYNNKFFCSGIGTCTMDVNGYYGEKLTWKSTCGGYAYTTIDGINEYAEFSCPETNQSCTSQQCEDGSWTKCYIDYNGQCVCSTCPEIIIKPVCGNGICESGEGEICVIPMIACEEGKSCEIPKPRCKIVCPEDCSNLPGIYAKLNEKFKLQVSQQAKITDYKYMKITFRDLLTPKCEAATTTSEEVKSKIAGYAVPEETPSSSVSGGGSGVSIIKCPSVGPMAQLEIEMPDVEGNKILTLKLNEAKNVYDVSISFLGYDYASRTGVFVVNSETLTCPVNCKCDSEGKILECKPVEKCKEKEVLCPDGICRETCEEIPIENCNSGCIYSNKCLPIGVRVKGLYCSIDGSLNNQLASDESCENNFECKSNVCVDSKCISSNLIQKIINWFKKLFGKD